MAQINELQVPFKDRVIDERGMLWKSWQEFFKFLKIILDPLGIERTYNLLNNQAVPVKIPGLRFKPTQIGSFCDYVILRKTSSNERVASGRFKVIYRPDAATFDLEPDPNEGPDVVGVTLTINNDGEVFYTSTNLAGVPEKFKLAVRQSYLLTGNLIA